ncbi:hypothetical protein ABLE94_20120, partial [Gordonia sp. VNK1]|uniref:hypothetical protein n=1 Tax=Gordonia oleivorans TaxID=3156618 RepID=UPI0032B61A59
WTCATPELLRFSLRKPNLKQDNGVAPSRHAEPTHNYVTRAQIWPYLVGVLGPKRCRPDTFAVSIFEAAIRGLRPEES